MFKKLRIKFLCLCCLHLSLASCASTIKWEGGLKDNADSYMKEFTKFRQEICTADAEASFENYLRSYRGQGYWIPELDDDVDVDSIKELLPLMAKKISWIQAQKDKVLKEGIPGKEVTRGVRETIRQLLELKKVEVSEDQDKKNIARKESLKLLKTLIKKYQEMIEKVSFLSNFEYPVDHLKNRKVHDSYRENENRESVKISNFTALYRKILEDGAYNPDHTASDIYLRTTIDTLYYELHQHDFYISEDARYDADFVLKKIDSELAKGKNRIIERLTEWENRTKKAFEFYQSLTLPYNQVPSIAGDKSSTPNRQLILEHNKAAERLKELVYSKQAQVYQYWLNKSELHKAIFVLETILINEVGGVDGEEALERMDVARVVTNRLDRPKYLKIKKKDFIYPYLAKIIPDSQLKKERWLNALFKQGEFSFTYYYMSGAAKIFCPDLASKAKKLRTRNVEIALQVLKEEKTSFQTTRYFSRASMIGRIHMDTVWEDYIPYPERPGLIASGQEKILKAFQAGQYTFLYAFQDPEATLYQVLEIGGKNYAFGEKNGIKLFFEHRNPHHFRYFTKIEASSK